MSRDSLFGRVKAERAVSSHACSFPEFATASLDSRLVENACLSPGGCECLERSTLLFPLGERIFLSSLLSRVGHSRAKCPRPSHSYQRRASLVCALLVFEFDALFVLLETVPVATESRALSFSLYLWLGDRDCGFAEFSNFV